MEEINNEEKKMSTKVKEFIELLESGTSDYYSNYNAEHELFNSRMDMIHTLELEELTYHEVAHLAIDIRDVSRSRRQYKDAYLLREPIMKFTKENKKVIEDLRKLQEDLETVEKYMGDKHYNVRQKVKGVEKLTKNGSIENARKEDLINLNRLISQYTDKYDSSIIDFGDDYSPCEIMVKMWMKDCIPHSFNQLRNSTMSIKSGIEKFFAGKLPNNHTNITVSDMLSRDEFDQDKLDSIVTITTECTDTYMIRLRLYGIMKPTVGNGKNGKKSKKTRRR